MVKQHTRRAALGGLAAAAALGAKPLKASAQPSDTVRIGVLTDMNGPLSEMNGPGTVTAARMAIEDFGQRNPGIKVALETADMQNKADLTVTIAREWLDNRGVDLITDVPLSAGALAIASLVAPRDKLAIFTSAATTALTGRSCGTNHIQWTHDTYAMSRAVVETQLRSGSRKWFFITADTAFGHDLEANSIALVKAGGGAVMGAVRHPFPGNPDFSSYLIQAKSSGADIIGLANSGSDSANCVKQAVEFGIFQGGQKMAGLFMDITAVQAIGLEVAQGVLLTEAFYWDASEGTRGFAKRFMVRHGKAPTPQHAGQYSAVTAYLNAVGTVGVAEAKRSGRAVLERMRSSPVDDPLFGPTTIRIDGRVIHPMLVLQVKAPSQSTSRNDVYTIASVIPADQAFRPLNEGGCPLVPSDDVPTPPPGGSAGDLFPKTGARHGAPSRP